MCPLRIYQSFCCIMKTVAAAEFSVRVGLGGQVGVRLAPSARAPPVPGPLPSLLIQLHGTTFNFTFFSDNFNTRYEYTHCILCIHFDFLSKTKKFLGNKLKFEIIDHCEPLIDSELIPPLHFAPHP